MVDIIWLKFSLFTFRGLIMKISKQIYTETFPFHYGCWIVAFPFTRLHMNQRWMFRKDFKPLSQQPLWVDTGCLQLKNGVNLYEGSRYVLFQDWRLNVLWACCQQQVTEQTLKMDIRTKWAQNDQAVTTLLQRQRQQVQPSTAVNRRPKQRHLKD